MLSFVKTDAISVEKVHRLLKERETLACVVAKAYTFASEYLITFSIDYMFEVQYVYQSMCPASLTRACALLVSPEHVPR